MGLDGLLVGLLDDLDRLLESLDVLRVVDHAYRLLPLLASVDRLVVSVVVAVDLDAVDVVWPWPGRLPQRPMS